MPAAERFHAMDNLRALAMLAGVVFHAALAYSPLMHALWPAADAGNAVAVDVVAWFLHSFRMPLFFAVAGFFAALLVARRGLGGLFRHRCARVLLPLLLFLPPVLLSLHGLTERAAATVAQPSPALAWVAGYLREHGALPVATGWAHLWFLFYLMLFTVLVWVASALGLGRWGARLASLPPAGVAGLLPLALAPALAATGMPWPAPDGFLPMLWALAFFGLYFALGYQLFAQPGLLGRLRPLAPWLLVGAVSAYAWLFVSTGGFMAVADSAAKRGLHALLAAAAGAWMTLWCLLAAQRWLAGRSAAMRWLSDASYWVYLAHLPVLFAIQYRLLDVTMSWPVKFAVSVIGTGIVCLASYQLLVRHTPLGRLLNGARAPAAPMRVT